MKIAHIADLHFCKEHAEEALASLRYLADHIKKSPVSMVALAGDTWDASMLNTEGSGFNRFIDAIREIADLAPVAMIYGTPAHDTDGSLEVFRKLTCKYGITVLDPGQPYFLTDVNGRGKIVQEIPGVSGKAVIFGIPEPRKKYLLSDTSAGKDETEEAVRAAMHRLCFFLAAKRRDYSDIPCIVLYHGDVAGTVYQNDQTVERGTGIAITIDELADIGADYYALGHIHKPQKVGNINAYYAGSIYPKNFGETHQASFKLVDIEPSIENERLTSVNTIDFPHPQNQKIERVYPKIEDLEAVTGKRVWLEITCTKEDRAFIDTDVELKALHEKGAVEGSRVTISEAAVETVRAAEITAVNTPEKKFEIWAENSNIETTARHTQKITELNAEISKNDVKPEGAWELLSLRLKGSTGIIRGIKKEEIFINFEKYSDGLIALSGANGKGKTTCIENCHPYPQLFTRKGKLQDHFSLKDSLREVIYRNRADSSLWKFLIQIDGLNKTGSCKYFIFKQAAGSDWQPLPGVDGNLKPYEEALGAIFGPVELFRRTAFITQKSTKDLPDITDATAGEKKSLFIALAGIDYLQGFADAAAEKVKLQSAKTHDADIKAQVLQNEIEKKPAAEQSLKDAESALKTKNAELSAITKNGKAAKASVDHLQTAWSAEQVRQQKENDAKASVDALCNEINNLALDIDLQNEAAENKANYELDIAAFEAAQKIIEKETAEKQKFTEASLKKQQEYATAKAAYDEKVKALETERDALCDKRTVIERKIATAESNINIAGKDEEVERNRALKPLSDEKALRESQKLGAENNIKLYERDAAEIAEDCPTCGQKLPENKIAELKAKRDEYVQKIAGEKSQIDYFNKRLAEIANETADVIKKYADQRDEKIVKEKAEIQKHNDAIADINKQIDELGVQVSALAFEEPAAPKNNETFDDRKLKAAQEKQNSIDIALTRASLAQAQQAAVRIEALQKQMDEKHGILKAKEAEYKKVKQEPEIGAKIKADLDAATKRHQELTEQYTAAKSSIARGEEAIEAIKKSLADIAGKEKEHSALKAESQAAAVEGQEWELISKAFGKDGIQALELDALAPGISETANRILKGAYGDRYRIEIRTTRIGGAGKKTKQIEDFLIYVIDSEDGEAVLLDDKSGGEAVWIKRAIYDAFAVIRKRNTNFSFLTCFQDETDGALDSAAKTAYCRMLEAAHAESKLRHTIIITHSNEVKAMIEQRIEMENLGGAA